MTKDELIKTVLANVKTGKWLSATFTLTTDKGEMPISLKSYGRWIQRIECLGVIDSIPEQKTNKGLIVALNNSLDYFIKVF